MSTGPLGSADCWPRPGDRALADQGLDRWQDMVRRLADPDLKTFAEALPEQQDGRALLLALFGNSPYLTDCALREPALLRTLLADGPDATFAGLMADMDAQLKEETDTTRLMHGLRVAKRRVALLIALADIGGIWPLEAVTGALSDFAERALRLAVAHLLRQTASRGAFALPNPDDPAEGSGLIVLAMGKLGSGELNYSSDIDLIVLYDEARLTTDRPDDLPLAFIRLTRALVRIMEERTADGYVFRTDLRLRPDPGATPLAVSVNAAESYYGSLAQTWERAAMIKARPVAGDAEAGRALMTMLRSFVWRRSMDFTSIEDIHAIKRRIADFRGHATIAVPGHDIKLGRGGIREIEFFAQTHQMIFGGRTPELRTPKTRDVLNALARTGRIDRETADTLTDCYRFLRTVEHRLQMIDDRQTQRLPETSAGMDVLVAFLGPFDGAAFHDRMRDCLRSVEAHYVRLFEATPALPGDSRLVLSGADDDPETAQLLTEMGFADPAAVVRTARGWLSGRYRAIRSERSRRLLADLLPALLTAVARTPNPGFALNRLDGFLGRLPAGIQLFALFHANPSLLTLVAELLGASERMADYLARHPDQLDAVLTPGFFDTLPDAEALERELAGLLAAAAHYEQVLDLVRRWTNDHRFRAGVHGLRAIGTVRQRGRFLSDIAEIGIRALQPAVKAEFARVHGMFAEPGLAVIAMGKLGGREMSIGSDLDLIMVYDVPSATAPSDGPKPLDATRYYTRLIQRLISAITAPTAEGPLYEVDMRLRPSGRAGPLATSLEAFVRYQDESAWTWEHMALTRARFIAGPPRLRNEIDRAIAAVLRRRRDPDSLLRDVASMRARIEKSFGTKDPWTVKYVRGGLIDIEFIAQYLQLRHGHDRPEVLHRNTDDALAGLAQAGILEAAVASELRAALSLWQRVQAYLRLTQGEAFNASNASPAMLEGLAATILSEPTDQDDEAGPKPDFAEAERRVIEVAANVYEQFRILIEKPAADLPAADIPSP
ncbi:MAG: bifunctional [glutamine synthetase] adenylyltransferase/[glutamine synthetase]-adenylyl-L-tyrosine phosphorylase [Inquilinaceae bacterium]